MDTWLSASRTLLDIEYSALYLYHNDNDVDDVNDNDTDDDVDTIIAVV